MPKDFSHLNAIELRLSNERARLANAKTESEIAQRKVWVTAAEKELQSERVFLGIASSPQSTDAEISDDDLLAELGISEERQESVRILDRTG